MEPDALAVFAVYGRSLDRLKVEGDRQRVGATALYPRQVQLALHQQTSIHPLPNVGSSQQDFAHAVEPSTAGYALGVILCSPFLVPGLMALMSDTENYLRDFYHLH